MEIRAKARRLRSQEKNLGLIIVDYLQLMMGDTGVENRQQEISRISRGLKILARELEVPVLALSQLSRQVEQRAGNKPVLSDLRESGAIEQDADLVMFIYRDEVYNRDSQAKGTAEIIVGKQRNGPIGECNLAFAPNYTRFSDLADARLTP
jgi:replicative DNA helicase